MPDTDTQAPMCQALKDRQQLTEAIQRATSPTGDIGHFADMPADGSEKALAIAFSILHGIVAEYLDGGDQMVELCDCGKHVDQPRMFQSPATKFVNPEKYCADS